MQSKSFFDLYDLAHSIISGHDNLQTVKVLHDEFKKMDYKQISNLLKFLEHMSHGNQVILEIMKNIKVNPMKTLMFNQIMEQFNK
ncbi:hypothetical protein FACS1894166_01880 [Bacilli bacterium]|nr:hypothetical protein FACS1894166_01880 [Bacilli bacterium]